MATWTNYRPEEAEGVLQMLRQTEDEADEASRWTYTAEPNGRHVRILVIDEEGILLGYL